MRGRNYEENDNLAIYLGAICALLAAISSWYTIAFNDSRFIVPMDLSNYVFRAQDLPIIISGTLLALYIVYLAVLLFQSTSANKRRGSTSRSTRTVNPKLGFLGLFGFAGFLGFWTYRVDQTIFPFVFFVFLAFSDFLEGNVKYPDRRTVQETNESTSTANKLLCPYFFAILILGQGRLMGCLEYTLIALVIVTALSIALELFLSEYLLYHYDHDEPFDESEE